jgi:hypothetical protein
MTGKAAVSWLEMLGQYCPTNTIYTTNKLSENEGICEWCPNPGPRAQISARISTTNNKLCCVLAKSSALYSVVQLFPVVVRCK